MKHRVLPPFTLSTLAAGLWLCSAPALAQDTASKDAAPKDEAAQALPTIAAKTARLERRSGLLDFYLDSDQGRFWLEVPAPAEGAQDGEIGRYLYVEALTGGLGSNPVNLDRGQLGDTRMVRLRRVGGRLLFEQMNTRFRASSEDDEERRAVQESFASSVLWAGEIAAQDPDGHFLVDFTSFLIRDAHRVQAKLKATEQGAWALDPARSAVDFDASFAFPDNLEIDAVLTYGLKDPASEAGDHVQKTAPTSESVTLVQHHSLVRLPADGFRPRTFDPRAGSYGIPFLDYGVPLDEPIERDWVARFRLEKTDPSAARSKVVEPIVFYLDPGTPEPVRGALLEGASWWAEAFEAAGFVEAFQVRLLPPDVHPLDVRYNVIQWVHRSTRGWSYGGGVFDPRTGEIVKGHVNLGSLRVRQDRLLFEGLLGTEKTGSGAADDPIQLALARIRQLAAHEVGHALGLNHNFAASTYADRASVMDYPAPLVAVRGDRLDVSRAYGVGVGAWDRHAIRWAYSSLPEGADEDAALETIVREGIEAGLIFITDEDARPAGAAHPLAHLWDNGSDPLEGLEATLAVRRFALDRFGEGNLAPGRPLALLQEVLVPVYFHHRYQLEAAVKLLGGIDYVYAVRGDGQPAARPVAAARQRAALETILGLLEPQELDLPDEVLALLLPRPTSYPVNPEMFRGSTAPTFDPLAAAATAADLVARGLVQRERAARMVDLHRRNPALPGFGEVLGALLARAFPREPESDPRRAELQRTVQWVVARALIDLASDSEASPAVRTRAEAALEELRRRVTQKTAAANAVGDALDPTAAHRKALAEAVRRFLERADEPFPKPAGAPEAPPGSPIGAGRASTLPTGTTPELGGCSWHG